jgi:membrane-associated phospholipid phosphatase
MAIKAIGSTTTILVSALFFAVLAWKRDALMVSFFIGAISNGILSKVLKRIINQTRPPELEHVNDIHLKPGDNGMPSSHAMSLGFISTFIACNLAWTQIPLALYVVVSLAYRVQVKLHTWQQVAVGSVVGTLNGWTWFRLCTGDNPWNVNVMNALATTILDENGVLPIPFMIVPLVVGAATIGSFERRIGAWLKRSKSE